MSHLKSSRILGRYQVKTGRVMLNSMRDVTAVSLVGMPESRVSALGKNSQSRMFLATNDTVDRQLALIQLACSAVAARVEGSGKVQEEELSLVIGEDDLRFMFAHNIDSALYIAFDPQAAVQSLYQALTDRQMKLAHEVGELFESANLKWTFVQGVESTHRLFQGQAFGRRGDIDILVDEADTHAATEILTSIGLAQLGLSIETQMPVRVSNEMASKISASHYYEKIFPYSRIETLNVTEDVADLVAGNVSPIFKTPKGVVAFIGAEITNSYGFIDTNILLEGRCISDKYKYFLESNLNFLIAAKRLHDGMLRKEPRLKLLCELVIRITKKSNAEELLIIAREYGLEAEMLDIFEIIDAVLESPTNIARLRSTLLAEFLSQ